ncbi:MAG: dephospho-CoA kinase [Oscillospiraceae bacterium]|nr:dephospho-CoA kinase [Oscillospiraceae bacterium]MDD4546129.1 dephospho-CoA kinase [Oscillospiraceae bacterium]
MIEKLYVVGLTGPTGSGKSVVSGVFVNNNISVIDTDTLAREVVEPGSVCLQEIVDNFSDEILNSDGTLNRRELARRAFSTPENTRLLNSITHPHIIKLTKSILMQMEQAGESIAVIDAPLLFESGMNLICDRTIAVIASYDKRLKRILQRDSGLDEELARARMASQQSEDYYTSRATVVLNSNGEIDVLREQAEKLARSIREWSHEK